MKTVLIIGASSGIGKALAQLLVEKGYNVYGTYNSAAPATLPNNVEYHHLDVMSDTVDFDYLPSSLDALVYCPGSIKLKPFHRILPEVFTLDYSLQVLGAIKCIQRTLPRLSASGNASIILFSTVAVQRGYRFHSLVSSSKGAISMKSIN
ncbi:MULTISPECIES: SDR family oxidoreductase [unclassified Carboxylicivirga]|uniref:SDR family oxidoreductase n=1 Tax=Carboxylicivirga TaxID=1628153 RepID=UPI003D32C793